MVIGAAGGAGVIVSRVKVMHVQDWKQGQGNVTVLNQNMVDRDALERTKKKSFVNLFVPLIANVEHLPIGANVLKNAVNVVKICVKMDFNIENAIVLKHKMMANPALKSMVS